MADMRRHPSIRLLKARPQVVRTGKSYTVVGGRLLTVGALKTTLRYFARFTRYTRKVPTYWRCKTNIDEEPYIGSQTTGHVPGCETTLGLDAV